MSWTAAARRAPPRTGCTGKMRAYTHPVGLATPAHLQAESAGPFGKSVQSCFKLSPVSLTSLRIMGQMPFSM